MFCASFNFQTRSREEIMKMVLEIRNKVNVERLEEGDFKDFWDNIGVD